MTVDETSPNARRKRTRVLRAADVIPPFDKNTEAAGEGHAGTERRQLVSPAPNGVRQDVTGSLVVAVGPTGNVVKNAERQADVTEIPRYDLAANILAEQRRAASRRRRAPGQPDDKPVMSRAGFGPKVSTPPSPPQGVAELQQIVAEIVARDIERLCRRPRFLT